MPGGPDIFWSRRRRDAIGRGEVVLASGPLVRNGSGGQVSHRELVQGLRHCRNTVHTSAKGDDSLVDRDAHGVSIDPTAPSG